MSNDNEIAIGQFAEELLNNLAYIEAFKRVEKRLFDEFKSTGSSFFGKKKREHIHKQVQTVSAIQEEIKVMVANGKFLQQEEARKERAKNFKGL